ncbi:MAG: RcnB family protein [Sphingorhabdus sp.]|uniref:RcnB family protein n=1 Tax=Sphingorhabdus sp. TaxID=1902408 RepID=UPI0038FC6071
MKKIILATLAATSLMTPAVSQAATQMGPVSSHFDDSANFKRGDGDEREGRRSVRIRSDRDDNRKREEAGQRNQDQPNLVQVRNWSQERERVRGDDDRGRDESVQRNREPSNQGQVRNWSQERSRERSDDNRRYRGGERHNGGGGNNRHWNNDDDDRGDRWNHGQNYKWKQAWRNDNRYNWRGHRDRYRNHYNPGRYYSPYRGHSYRRFGIGINIGSGYYGSRYWISDPSYYRLPPAYGPYRWVRYYDDVLLIDLRSGRVVDAIHDFFW